MLRGKRQLFGIIMVAALLMGAAGTASAANVYVGSWQVDQGPVWWDVPTAYTGQEAAALLFGGNASDYHISTIDSNPLNINFLNWISTWGVAGGQMVAENFEISTGGLYQNYGDTSAYIWDNAQGASYTNYAFRVDRVAAPEPATFAMTLTGLTMLGGMILRRKQSATSR